MTQKTEISAKTIVFTVFFLLSLTVIWQIRELIFSLFIAFIIAAALRPAVDFLGKKRLPTIVASLFIYSIFVLSIFGIFNLVIPPLVGEVITLAKNFPQILKSTLPKTMVDFNFDLVTRNLPSITNQTFNIIKGLFSNIIFVTSTLFFGFYFLSDRSFVKKLLINFVDDAHIGKVETIVERAQKRMAAWFWGEIILMVVIGTMTFVGLSAVGIKYALALSVLAGMLEVIPTLGPVVSAIPSFLIGLSVSPALGFYTILINIIIQQLENNLVVPVIMKKVVGLHPIITLIVLIVGGKLAGIMGVLLAVPTTIFIETVLIESQKINQK